VSYDSADVDWQAARGTNLLFSGTTHQWVSAITRLRPEFMELTGIDLRMELGGESELSRSLSDQLAAGSPSPDVFMVPSYGQATAAGWLEPLDDYLEDPARTDAAWYRLDDVYPSAMEFVRRRGTTYGLPVTAEAQTTIYRTDLIDPPPATFEEVLEAARRAKDRAGLEAGIALRGKPTAEAVAWPAAGYVFTYGGYLIDPDGRSALASQPTVEGVQMYADILKAGGPEGVAGWDWREINTAMQQGRAAMMQDSSNAIPDLQDPARSSVSDRIAAVAFPSHEGRSNPNLWHWIVGMNNNSRNKTGAWLFLLWATSKTTGLELARVGVTPPRASAWADPSFQEGFGEQESLVVLDELQALDSRPMTSAWMHPRWPQVGDAFARAVTAAATTDTPAAATLAVAHREAVAALS
jgi:multiple sugar transport system substrate-binding protein